MLTVTKALRRTGANYTRAAELLGVKRQAAWAAALRGQQRSRLPVVVLAR